MAQFIAVRPQSIVRGYADLVAALRRRRRLLGFAHLEVDRRAGLANGHYGKLEQWDKSYGRGLGAVTLPLVLEALGLGLLVVQTRPCGRVGRRPENPEQLELEL